jgi:anion-transporting  ArsA/GET3 family ATPase
MTSSWLDDLLGRRLLLVTGKGGTGKSICAAAFALLAQRRGLRTLLVEIESSASARTIFEIHKPGLQPKRSSSGVEVACVEFQRGVEEVVHDVMKVPKVVRVMLRHPIISRFLRAAPSALDFVTLFMATRFVREGDQAGAPLHDLVVVDMPALGHARVMLSVGRTARDLFRVGPIASRAAEIDDLITDPSKATAVVVTLPEEMPITETLEGCQALRDLVQVPLGPVIMNCTQPQHLDSDETALVEQMAVAAEEAGDAAGARALRRATEWSRWAEVRKGRLRRLRRDLDGQPVVTVPLFHGAVMSLELINDVAGALEGAPLERSRGTI